MYSSEVFCDSQKKILKENDIIKFPKLADTYRRIAEEGPDVFYNGKMAQTIVDDIQAAGLSLFLVHYNILLKLIILAVHTMIMIRQDRSDRQFVDVLLQQLLFSLFRWDYHPGGPVGLQACVE